MKHTKIFLVIVLMCGILSANAQTRKEVALIVRIDSVDLSKKLLKIEGISAVEIDMDGQIVVIKYDSKV